ncbi:hypothetical protein C2S53_018075 [Perilla frutescens var. hirtella]|uniref:Polygalacturonase n=1 Tax=Perilla frutescens var. hirtella TaxID=608512 RepID=A0AAD4J8D4_PERFH|nr:hypothetical protein C2S53_018075 [Perilla frutescens var. hirtella]
MFIRTINLFVALILAYDATAKPTIHDITTYGATPNEDISKALLNAWNAAIASKNQSKIVIPPGTWALSQAKLQGPNFAPIEIENQGTVQANPDPNIIPNKQAQWITINYVDFFTLSGGGVFDGQGGQQAWALNDCNVNKNCPKLPINLSFNFVNNSIIHDVTTKDSKTCHINCLECRNVTFTRLTVSAPGNSPNTDGIHVARSTMVNVTDSVIGTGDDCISMGDKLTQVHIQNVTCGPGHGISIGSLRGNINERDISGIHVKNCTFVNTQNGVRIKTWPSTPATLQISNLHFEDLTMQNASNPIVIDQQYCPWNLCNSTSPSLIEIRQVIINNVKGTTNSLHAVMLSCSPAKPCEDIQIRNVDLNSTTTKGTKPGLSLR